MESCCPFSCWIGMKFGLKMGPRREVHSSSLIYHKAIAINSCRAQPNSLLDARFPACTINQHETLKFQFFNCIQTKQTWLEAMVIFNKLCYKPNSNALWRVSFFNITILVKSSLVHSRNFRMFGVSKKSSLIDNLD
jgi:hypothetical protein